MGEIDSAALAIPTADQFAHHRYRDRYEFVNYAAAIERLVHVVAEPLLYARILQEYCRPLWFVENVDFDLTRSFRLGFVDAAARLGARVEFFPDEYLPLNDPGRIIFRWHQRGQERFVLHYKEAYLPDTYHLDRSGYSGWSEVQSEQRTIAPDYASADICSQFYESVVAHYIQKNTTKYEQMISDEDFSKWDYVFLPLQTTNDAVMALSYFGDYLEAVENIVAFLAGRGVHTIIKRHPRCEDDRIEALIQKLQKSFGTTRAYGSIHHLIKYARGVITMNSGVGFEALMQLKPVILFGRADYDEVCTKIKTTADFPKIISSIEATVDEQRIKAHLHILMSKYQVNATNPVEFDRALLRALCLHLTEGRKRI